MISSPQKTHVRSAVSPQQSIQEENEQPEVVGATQMRFKDAQAADKKVWLTDHINLHLH